MPNKKAKPLPGVIFLFLLTKEVELVSVCSVCLSWVSCTAWKELAEETQGQFLPLSLSSHHHPSAGKPVIFSGKPLNGDEVSERRCHGTKPTEVEKLACFSCRKTAT